MTTLLVARYPTTGEFRERFQRDENGSEIFYPTRRALPSGSPVVLDVRMPQLRDAMLVRAKVIWRQRGKRGTSQRAGLGLKLLPEEEPKMDHLLRLIDGNLSPEEAQRKNRRVPVALRVGWRVPSETERYYSHLVDISTGGLFLRTEQRPEKGTPLVVELKTPGNERAQMIEGRVAWTSEDVGGLGVEFRCRDIGGMRRLRELVRRIEDSALA